MEGDRRFALLVGLACHDLRTPLATVHGFARTLERVELADPAPRYIEMIGAASDQLAELLDELSLVARVESGRFEPHLSDVDSLELAQSVAAELEEGKVVVRGEGEQVCVEPHATQRAIRQLARAAARHAGLASVELVVRGAVLELSPVTDASAPVLTGEQLRELGPAAALTLIDALGGSVERQGETLVIRLPQGTAVSEGQVRRPE